MLGTVFSSGLIHSWLMNVGQQKIIYQDISGFGYAGNTYSLGQFIVHFGLFIGFVDNKNILNITRFILVMYLHMNRSYILKDNLLNAVLK